MDPKRRKTEFERVKLDCGTAQNWSDIIFVDGYKVRFVDGFTDGTKFHYFKDNGEVHPDDGAPMSVCAQYIQWLNPDIALDRSTVSGEYWRIDPWKRDNVLYFFVSPLNEKPLVGIPFFATDPWTVVASQLDVHDLAKLRSANKEARSIGLNEECKHAELDFSGNAARARKTVDYLLRTCGPRGVSVLSIPRNNLQSCPVEVADLTNKIWLPSPLNDHTLGDNFEMARILQWLERNLELHVYARGLECSINVQSGRTTNNDLLPVLQTGRFHVARSVVVQSPNMPQDLRARPPEDVADILSLLRKSSSQVYVELENTKLDNLDYEWLSTFDGVAVQDQEFQDDMCSGDLAACRVR